MLIQTPLPIVAVDYGLLGSVPVLNLYFYLVFQPDMPRETPRARILRFRSRGNPQPATASEKRREEGRSTVD
jgi:hypothetical protein